MNVQIFVLKQSKIRVCKYRHLTDMDFDEEDDNIILFLTVTSGVQKQSPEGVL